MTMNPNGVIKGSVNCNNKLYSGNLPLEPFLLPVPRLSSYIIVDGEQARASAIALSVYLSRL